MEIEIVRKEGNEVEFDVIGDKTVAVLVTAYLLNDENVDFAAFRQDHPLENRIRVAVRVKDGDPLEAVKSAAEKAKADFIKFQMAFQEAMKE
jgi:DNA-directed RNA polymerase subunit L